MQGMCKIYNADVYMGVSSLASLYYQFKAKPENGHF